MHLGIDYGSKLAGTTAIVYDEDDQLKVIASVKKQDADEMILATATEKRPNQIYLDAPLSLPAAYFGKGDNYFYRKADAELRAMSPMFLGGLTARAMSLKTKLKSVIDCEIIETYPGAFVRNDEKLKRWYDKKDKEKLQVFTELLEAMLPLPLAERPLTWHTVDAIIAWNSGYRHQKCRHLEVGDKEEGVIVF